MSLERSAAWRECSWVNCKGGTRWWGLGCGRLHKKQRGVVVGGALEAKEQYDVMRDLIDLANGRNPVTPVELLLLSPEANPPGKWN